MRARQLRRRWCLEIVDERRLSLCEDSAAVFQKRHAQVHRLGFAWASEDFRGVLSDVRAAHLIGGIRAAAMEAERAEHHHAARGHNRRHPGRLAEVAGLVAGLVIAHMLDQRTNADV